MHLAQKELFHYTLAAHSIGKTILFKKKTNGDYCKQFSAFLVHLKEFIRVSSTKGETKVRNDSGSCEEVA